MPHVKRILRRGEYEAILYAVKDETSKKGNPMWVLHWEVFENADSSVPMLDWIVKGEKGAWKMEPLARALGRLKEFEQAHFTPADHLECHVTLIIDIQTQMGFEQRNTISGYKPPRTT